MKFRYLVLAALLSVMAAPSQAAWLTGLTLTQVGSGDSGGEYVWFSTSQAVSNPAGCASADIYVLRTLPKNALAILLAAHLAGKPVRAFVSPTSCDVASGRPLITEVGVQ